MGICVYYFTHVTVTLTLWSELPRPHISSPVTTLVMQHNLQQWFPTFTPQLCEMKYQQNLSSKHVPLNWFQFGCYTSNYIKMDNFTAFSYIWSEVLQERVVITDWIFWYFWLNNSLHDFSQMRAFRMANIFLHHVCPPVLICLLLRDPTVSQCP